MAAGNVTSKIRHDYEFVTQPSNSYECSICLQTLRDPHIISCCGNEFCQICIERVQRDVKPCPLCNEPKFTTMLNKKLAREINAFEVHCPQSEHGCHWVGQLGHLDKHLHPTDGSSDSKGCDYVVVACAYQCGTQLQRRLLSEHEVNECPRRPVEMQISSLVQKLNAAALDNQLFRKELDKTKESQRVMECEHESKMTEMRTEIGSLKQIIGEVRRKNAELEKANQDLKQTCTTLSCELDFMKGSPKQSSAGVETHKVYLPLTLPPFYFDLCNTDHFKEFDYNWLSDSFYSHPGGYKLGVSVYPNGFGRGHGTHLSIYVHIRRGEFDDSLKWPFNGEIVIQALNTRRNKWINDIKFSLNDTNVDKDVVQKPMNYSNVEWGYSKYISHTELENEYRVDETKTSFRVLSVKVFGV